MELYAITQADGYEGVICCNDDDYDRIVELDGTRFGRSWRPIEVERVEEDEGQVFQPADFPWLLARALVMRQSAVDALRDLLDANGEVLGLKTNDGVSLSLFNTECVDALDEAASTFTRFQSSGRIMRISRPVFREDALSGVDLFVLPYRVGRTYVSERFVERVRSAGLVGLRFKKVWSSP